MELVKVCPPPCETINPASQFTCLKCQRSLVAVQPTVRTAPEPEGTPTPPAEPQRRLRRCPNSDCGFTDNPPDETECVFCNESLAASPQNIDDDVRNTRGTHREVPNDQGTKREVSFAIDFPFARVIVRDRVAIGRDAGFSPIAGEIQKYEKVSRRHAELRIVDDQLQVVDLGSMNRVYVNGAEISANTPFTLKRGDNLSFSSELKARVAE